MKYSYIYVYIGFTKGLANHFQSVFIPFHSKYEKFEFLNLDKLLSIYTFLAFKYYLIWGNDDEINNVV